MQMPLDLWLTFMAASAVLLVIPGPTVLLVLSYALSQGRRVAVASAAGVALGDLIAMTASLLGLGALVLTSALLFSALKWVGAAYLIYLGIKLLRAARMAQPGMMEAPEGLSARAVFGHMTLVTALNPKSIAFFIAFVPQFISLNAPLAPQFAILISSFVGFAAISALSYALLADRLRATINRPKVLQWITRSGGITLIGMGLMTAMMRRAT